MSIIYQDHRMIQSVRCTWTSDGTGDYSEQTAAVITGRILRVVTNPGADAPADNYDLEILDEDSVDVMGGAGANRDTANSEQIIPDPPVAVDSKLTFQLTQTVESASASLSVSASLLPGNAGEVVIYYTPN